MSKGPVRQMLEEVSFFALPLILVIAVLLYMHNSDLESDVESLKDELAYGFDHAYEVGYDQGYNDALDEYNITW